MSGNRIAKSASTALCLTLVMAGLASASIPKKISYQGRLLDGATGLPLAGSHGVTFRIYDAASGGDTLWTEAQTVSADSGGVISALLGSVKLIEADFSGPSWLEVEVDGEILLPRREIVSSAYAFRAMNADSVGGLPAASYSLATHNHDATYYVKPDLGTPGTINAGGNPVDWTKLKGVPAGFTDGVDDAGGLGDSHSLDAADGSPTDAVYVDDDGQVGVGTTSPGEALDVAGSINLTDALKIGGSTTLWVDSLSIFVGQEAGRINAASQNTFVGDEAGYSNTSGDGNTFVGAATGHANISGIVNTFLGVRAGQGNTTGHANTFVGVLSGGANEGGAQDTYVGAHAGLSNKSGWGNTLIGAGAGQNSLSGSENTCVGAGAGLSSNAGSFNTILGYYAGLYISGSNNVFLGYKAGYSETGSNKLYIANGPDTSDVLIFGDFAARRLGIGAMTPVEALDVAGSINLAGRLKHRGTAILATDSSNTFVGKSVGALNAGGYNTFVGKGAGEVNTSGDSNVFVGMNAGNRNSTGGLNTFVGLGAGHDNISGAANTFLGYGAGSDNTSGGSNTFLGHQAGTSNSTGVTNVCVGVLAGAQNETGQENTFLGAGSGHDNVNGSGNVFLGYKAGYAETGSDKLYIANGQDTADVFLYGQLGAGYSPRIGIGCLYPNSMLTVNANVQQVYPSVPSIVVGNLGNSSTFLVGSDVDNYGEVGWIHPQYLRIMTPKQIAFSVGEYFDGTGVDMLLDDSGNLGIGTTTPERKLHLLGDGPRILIESNGGNPEVNFESTDDTSAERWAIYKQSTEDDLRFYQNGDRVTFESGTGNVAIGTNDPLGYRLYVNGTAYATGGWQPSDLRLKTDLLDIEGALGRVLRLHGVSFRWRTEDHPDRGLPEGRHYGLVAQEVEQVLPEVVGTGPDGEEALAYTELIPVLVESIKELKTEVDHLRAENQSLWQRLEALERTGGR